MAKRKTTSQWTDGFISKHGDKYSYPEYIPKANEKFEIICPLHGIFESTPQAHLSGYGCKRCGIIKRSKAQTLTWEQNLIDFKRIHR